MKRIEYGNVERIAKDYLDFFSKDLSEMQRKWHDFRDSDNTFSNFPENVKDILIAKFEDLAVMYKRYCVIKEKTNKKTKLEKIFDYSGKYQSRIADFFRKHANEIGITTCYYCDTAYINVYNSNGKDASHFDLDHFFSQTNCPILALSVFNLIPSCPVCNERLKRDKDTLIVSPSSLNYSFEKDVTFKVMPTEVYRTPEFTDNPDSFIVCFDTNSEHYKKEIGLFRLNERYQFHKCEALQLLSLLQKYTDSNISMISRLFRRSEASIKEDIFKKEYVISNRRALSKLYKDILEV